MEKIESLLKPICGNPTLPPTTGRANAKRRGKGAPALLDAMMGAAAAARGQRL